MKVAIGAVIGGVVAYIVCNQLITALVTGTTTGDVLIQTVFSKTAAFSRKIGMITHQIRGTLNAFGRKLITELSRNENSGHVERLDGANPNKGYGIVRSWMKIQTTFAARSSSQLWSS